MEKIIFIFFLIKCIISINYFNKYSSYSNENIDNIYDISFENKNEMEFNIDPKMSYIFSIKNENYRYSFETNLSDKNILFFYNINNKLEPVSNRNYFKLGEKIYFINKYNLTETIVIKIFAIQQYSQLNCFETINESQYFFIEVKERSIAYFDSFDRNSKIYISNNTEKKITIDDKKINGEFIQIEPNITYFIKNEIYENTISVFKKYLYPFNLDNKTINVINNTINYLYLKKNGTYYLNLENNNFVLIILLSLKTIDSEIITIANEDSYQIDKDYRNSEYIMKNEVKTIRLIVNKNDAFIEFLTCIPLNDIQIFQIPPREHYKLEKNILNIEISKTQKNFKFDLFSKDEDDFYYSLSLGEYINIDENYDYEFIYTSNSNKKIKSKGSKLNLDYFGLFKNFSEDGLSFSIFIDKKEEQELFISYNFYSGIDDLLEKYEKEEYIKVIDDFKELFDLYVYTDIAKNPPQLPGLQHEKIDLFQEINNINLDDIDTTYELYQKLKKITCLSKDLHFNLQLNYPSEYFAFIPFNFIVKEDNKKGYRIFIEKNEFFEEFELKEKEFIESHLNIPIKKINNIDPFDYIQNWSQFSSLKNPHAQFSFIIDRIPNFSLSYFPVYFWNLTSNEYEFDDNQILRINYKISKIKINNFKFDINFMNIRAKNKFLFEMYSLGEIKDNFFISKLQKNSLKNEEKINWDFQVENNGLYLKCRVDEKNKVNVLVQNSFNINYFQALRTILSCARLFYSNNYPLIIIESKNNGGNSLLAKIMIQVFSINNVERSYNSFRSSFKDYYQKDKIEFIEPESCAIIDLMNIKEEIDYYDDLEIKHNRTKPMLENHLQHRKALNHFREEFKNSPFLKKPNEIIIFTDSYSFSSTSTLIKGFQNIGGAIIVGYFGNPKIEGTDLFDSSQSDSAIKEINKIFGDFIVKTITTQEIFDEYKDENPIPREYTFNPVDFRVDIYSKYSDDIYDNFITEAKNIINKFKNENYCNSKNGKFIIPDDNCRNMGENLHGGYKCSKDKDELDKSKCIPYYCEIGYYFDKYEQKCIKECQYENEVIFLYENNYTKEFNIKKNEKYEIFTYNPDNYYYVFQVSENSIYRESANKSVSRIYFHYPENENDNIAITNKRNSTNDINVKINTIEINFDLNQFKGEGLNLDYFFIPERKKISILEFYNDHILYIKEFLQNNIRFAKYIDEMSLNDIINLNKNYFTDINENILQIKKNDIYIIYFDHNISEQNIIQFFLWKEESDKEISLLNNNNQNCFYLKANNKYKFENHGNKNILFKLSRKTLNSEIKLSDKIILNKDNIYYNISAHTNFELSINNESAFIEVLYNYFDSYEEFEFEQLEFNLSKTFNIIKIPKKNYKNKIIKFELIGNDNSEFLIIHDYTIFPYFLNVKTEKYIKTKKLNISIVEPYPDSLILMENEFYYVMIKKNNETLNLYIKIEQKKENENDETNTEQTLSWWKIVLIVISSIILLVLIVFLIRYIKTKKSKSSKNIEESIENLEEKKELILKN